MKKLLVIEIEMKERKICQEIQVKTKKVNNEKDAKQSRKLRSFSH